MIDSEWEVNRRFVVYSVSFVVFYLFMIGVTFGWMVATNWGDDDGQAYGDVALGRGAVSLVWPLFFFWRFAGMLGRAIA